MIKLFDYKCLVSLEYQSIFPYQIVFVSTVSPMQCAKCLSKICAIGIPVYDKIGSNSSVACERHNLC